jgi:polyribonucleotide nucleotidyltransferase
MHKIFKLPELGLEIEIGKFARQADGSVWIRAGNNIVLATVVASKEEREFPGFFPLTVEYRERPSAAGKIPGGYIKREGKLSDLEVLASRLIDRPIRPLFPPFYFNEVQILCTVFSSDGKFPNNILSIIGASAALTISPIPFLGPIGAVQASKINGQWCFNANYEEIEKADSDITIAGTSNGICMIEGHCNEVSEEELIDLFFKAHEEIKKQIDWQLSIQKELGVTQLHTHDKIDWESLKVKVKNALPENFVDLMFSTSKSERRLNLEKLNTGLFTHFANEMASGEITESVITYLFDILIKENIPDAIARKNARLDGRGLTQVRQIYSEAGILPCVHGSAFFQRGETQALASLTLGTNQDAQKVETILGGVQERSFMLHYNFPPFSTGEVKPIRGASRRDIGHGSLAESSFLNVLPTQDEFPYTIRTVVDILESNGSSSMASVCATTLALMDGGIHIKNMVSGIAMGLVRDSSGKFHVLTDILGDEDAFGLMDFKVTGTENGVMAFQLDIKDKVGLPRDIFVKALEQAKEGRLFILGEMKKALDAPRKQLSDLAPRVITFKIPQDKIGAIIGPAGKTIKEIVAKTNTQIDIDDDGKINVYSRSSTAAAEAESWVRILSGDIKVGSVFSGIVRRIVEFGLFVELVPGKEGLVHISAIAKSKQRGLDKLIKPGDKLTVKVTAYDRETDRIRLVAPDLEKT